MKIAICDDNSLQIDFFKAHIDEFLKKRGDKSYTLNTYSSGKPLIDDIADGQWYDIVVLDVVLDNENGVDIAKELRECGYNGNIAFWTAHKDFVFDALDVEFTHYIIKGNEHGRMFSMIDNTLSDMKHKMLTIRHRDCIIRIPLNKIEYLEARDKQVFVHCTNGIMHSMYEALKSVEPYLDKRFLRCHKSFVVNMDYVQKLDSDFTMFSGDKVLIRKNGYADIKNQYLEYIIK